MPASASAVSGLRSIKLQEAGTLTSAHSRRAIEYNAQIETAQSCGEQQLEADLRRQLCCFLEACHATYDLAEMLPIEQILAAKVPFRRQTDLDQIQACVQRIGDLRTHCSEERLTRAVAFLVLKQYQAALDQTDSGLSIDSNHTHLRCARGQVLLELERFEEAHQEYTWASRQSPNSSLALGGLGRSLLYSGQAKAAIVPLKRCLNIVPKDSEIWCLTAQALAATGNLVDALAATRHCLSLESGNRIGGLLMGELLESLGHHREASAHYSQLIKLHFQSAGERRARLPIQSSPNKTSTRDQPNHNSRNRPKLRPRLRKHKRGLMLIGTAIVSTAWWLAHS